MDANQTYRVLRLAVENYKRLKAVDLTPPRNAVIVAGKNKQGKTSLLDSIAAVLGGKKQMADVPVRQGQAAGQIVAVLGDAKPELLVRRVFTEDGRTALEITTNDGYKAPSPQAILDGLCNAIAFDPLAFSRMAAQDQQKSLQALVGLNFDDMDKERQRLYDERRNVNRDVKSFESSAAGIQVPDGLPILPIDTKAILAEQAEAQRRAQDHARERSNLKTAEARLQELVARRKELLDEIGRIDVSIGNYETDVASRRKTVAILEEPDMTVFQKRIMEAQEINNGIAKRDNKQRILEKAEAAKALASQLTQRLQDIDAEKAKAVAETKWPIEGLAFGEGEVLYNGLPFSQASGAEQLAISFAIAAASHPRLKIALIRDASLLDDDQLKAVCDLAEKHDSQVWLETVGDALTPCAVYIEDGSAYTDKSPTRSPLAEQAADDEAERNGSGVIPGEENVGDSEIQF